MGFGGGRAGIDVAELYRGEVLVFQRGIMCIPAGLFKREWIEAVREGEIRRQADPEAAIAEGAGPACDEIHQEGMSQSE